MNIFYFDYLPFQCAKDHCDRHVVKMIVEYAQLLSTCHRVLDGQEKTVKSNNRSKKVWILSDERNDNIYKASHINHPSNKWVRQSASNYFWLLCLWLDLLNEYTMRYGKVHKTSNLEKYLLTFPKNIPFNLDFTPPFRAMPDEFKIDKIDLEYCQKSYHKYFNNTKQHIAKWKHNEIPRWYIQKG